ncbi:MAG TPA: 23S rRNA pseudouridine(1911/1915/1917) synthase RluD [Candidatus Binatia bacterium]|nr:23S rRNA pseudouridine(1911/1915/1917) synthase RluD [Candidatus Binatia bacterium]
MKRDKIISDGGNDPSLWMVESMAVPPEMHGARLDVAAARLFDRHSRARLQRWIADGHLRVNTRVTTVTRARVRAGDELRLKAPRPVSSVDPAQAMALDLRYEDESLIVVNKPAGLSVHPGAGRPDGTLLNALLHRYPRARTLPRAGLVHRLDMDTTGLMVIALSETAHARLVEMMERRQVRREYDAVVIGLIPAGGTVRAAVGRHPRDRVKMAVVPRGKPAVTHYRVVERFAEHTHLRLKLETGRTHQIRVHMAYVRHPVVGDPVYGGRVVRGAGMPEDLRRQLATFPRQALHARELEFAHPITRARVAVSSEPPEDMQALLRALREHSRTPGG